MWLTAVPQIARLEDARRLQGEAAQLAQQRRWMPAMLLYTRALPLHPGSAVLWRSRALCRRHLGDWAGALQVRKAKRAFCLGADARGRMQRRACAAAPAMWMVCCCVRG